MQSLLNFVGIGVSDPQIGFGANAYHAITHAPIDN